MSALKAQCDSVQQFRDEALCRSVFYGAFSLALHYPSAEIVDRLRSEETILALQQAAALLSHRPLPEKSEPDSMERGPVDLVASINDWIRTFHSLTLDSLLTAQSRLFGHTARALICPYETEYGQEGLFQQPRQMARIAGFYRAFGLTVRNTERERADHASCELEFLDFLSRKEAYALQCGDGAMLEETRKATRLFLSGHLGRFGRAFARLLREHDVEGFFGRLGQILDDFIAFECRRMQIQAGPPLLRLRSSEEDNVPMACGGESDSTEMEYPR